MSKASSCFYGLGIYSWVSFADTSTNTNSSHGMALHSNDELRQHLKRSDAERLRPDAAHTTMLHGYGQMRIVVQIPRGAVSLLRIWGAASHQHNVASCLSFSLSLSLGICLPSSSSHGYFSLSTGVSIANTITDTNVDTLKYLYFFIQFT